MQAEVIRAGTVNFKERNFSDQSDSSVFHDEIPPLPPKRSEKSLAKPKPNVHDVPTPSVQNEYDVPCTTREVDSKNKKTKVKRAPPPPIPVSEEPPPPPPVRKNNAGVKPTVSNRDKQGPTPSSRLPPTRPVVRQASAGIFEVPNNRPNIRKSSTGIFDVPDKNN